MFLRIATTCCLVACLLSLAACGEDVAAPASNFEWGANEYGDYYTRACGDFAADHESSEWVSENTVVLTKASGCGVYRAEMEFLVDHRASEMEFPGDYWTTEMDICNRCTSQQYLTWAMYADPFGSSTSTYAYYDHQSNSLKTPSGDFDGMPGPDYGDALTGLIRFTDTNQVKSVNQCDFRGQVTSNYDDPQPAAKKIMQIPISSGASFTTQVSFPMHHFMRDLWTNWGGNEPPQYWNRPVNFRSLEQAEYLWPRLRSSRDDRSVSNFPEAYCKELGMTYAERPLKEGTYAADHLQNKIPQAFELRVLDGTLVDTLVQKTVHERFYTGDESQ